MGFAQSRPEPLPASPLATPPPSTNALSLAMPNLEETKHFRLLVKHQNDVIESLRRLGCHRENGQPSFVERLTAHMLYEVEKRFQKVPEDPIERGNLLFSGILVCDQVASVTVEEMLVDQPFFQSASAVRKSDLLGLVRSFDQIIKLGESILCGAINAKEKDWSGLTERKVLKMINEFHTALCGKRKITPQRLTKDELFHVFLPALLGQWARTLENPSEEVMVQRLAQARQKAIEIDPTLSRSDRPMTRPDGPPEPLTIPRPDIPRPGRPPKRPTKKAPSGTMVGTFNAHKCASGLEVSGRCVDCRGDDEKAASLCDGFQGTGFEHIDGVNVRKFIDCTDGKCHCYKNACRRNLPNGAKIKIWQKHMCLSGIEYYGTCVEKLPKVPKVPKDWWDPGSWEDAPPPAAAPPPPNGVKGFREGGPVLPTVRPMNVLPG